MSNATSEALALMAKELDGQNCPLQAIHCWQAQLGLQLLPDKEVRARMHLGRLLMQHTRNYKDARQHLQSAQQMALKLLGNHCLKCEVLSQLGLFYKTIAADAACSMQVLRQGLECCEQGKESSERLLLDRWACYFHFHLADCQAALGQQQDSEQSLEMGAERAASASLNDYTLLSVLFRLQLSILQYDQQQSQALISSINELIWLQDGSTAPAMANLPEAFVSYAMLHFNVLQILLSLRSGSIAEISDRNADEPNSLLVVESSEALLNEVEGKQSGYQWLPHPVIRAILALVSATVLGSGGKAHLSESGLSSSSTEHDLDHVSLWNTRMPLVLRAAVLAQLAQMQLLMCDYEDARRSIVGVMGQALVHVLAGTYAYSLQLDEAEHHFSCAANCEGASSASVALSRTLLAASILSGTSSNRVSRAIEAMGPLYKLGEAGEDAGGETGAANEAFEELGHHERCCTQLVSSMIRASLGQEQDASLSLSKALKSAHKQLHNHLLVSSIMVVMTPLQIKAGDISGAQQLLGSAQLLAKNNCDIHTEIRVMEGLHQVYSERSKAGDMSEAEDTCREDNSKRLRRKEEELAYRISLAVDQDKNEHAAVLSWGMGSG
eukprot:gene18304-24764_t